MEKEKKFVIREVDPESAYLSTYFDGDGMTGEGGDYCYNLFIISRDRWGRVDGFNTEEYEAVRENARGLLEGFDDVIDGVVDYDGKKITFKAVMEEHGIKFSPKKCCELKEWAEQADPDDTQDIADFLTITTGRRWDSVGICGYSQGDYVEVVYCVEYYRFPEIYGKIWLGCAKEFGVIELDENGEEGDSTWGFIVADSQARTDEDYKSIVCEWAGIDANEARLEMFDHYSRRAEYRRVA